MQEITKALQDMELDLANIHAELQGLGQRMSALIQRVQASQVPPSLKGENDTAITATQRGIQPEQDRRAGKTSYGSSYYIDSNSPGNPASLANSASDTLTGTGQSGVQEVWTVGGAGSIYSALVGQPNELTLSAITTMSMPPARQSEYSIYARPLGEL